MKRKKIYHKCEFLTDGGSCIICGETVAEQFEEKSKEQNKIIKKDKKLLTESE